MTENRRRPRPIRGDFGRVLSGVLRAGDPDLTGLLPTLLSRRLRIENYNQLHLARDAGSPWVTDRSVGTVDWCPSAMLRNIDGWPCKRTWACPFCYARTALDVWKRVKSCGYQVQFFSAAFYQLSREEVGPRWGGADEWLAELDPAAKVLGRILWSWVDPGMSDGEATVRFAAVTVGDVPLPRLEAEKKFIETFQFGHAWLRAPAGPLMHALEFMGQRRGRRISGRFRRRT